MKTATTLIISVLCISVAIAQSQKLTFAFDAAGNQTTRTWVCVNCPTAAEMPPPDNDPDQSDSVLNVTSSILPFNLTVDIVSETIVIEKQESKPAVKQIVITDSDQITIRSILLTKNSGGSKVNFTELPPGRYLLQAHLEDETDYEIEITKI